MAAQTTKNQLAARHSKYYDSVASRALHELTLIPSYKSIEAARALSSDQPVTESGDKAVILSTVIRNDNAVEKNCLHLVVHYATHELTGKYVNIFGNIMGNFAIILITASLHYSGRST
ncbi:hypothetical protein H7171_02910 [Candidatus Saccharibacteria bacterium]|nr:hypothetical protein [Candidatus Saccharibacteria bacterium]